MLQTISQLHDMARGHSRRRLVVAAAHDGHALGAVASASQNKLVDTVLIGDEQKIQKIADEQNIDLAPFTIVHEPHDGKAATLAVKMIRFNEADILMKGNLATAILLREILNKEYGMRTGEQISHLALFELDKYHKLLGLTDAAMNIAPTLDQKVSIIRNAVIYFHKLGIAIPKVAVLSAVETVNQAMRSSMEASAISKMCDRGQLEGCLIDGPLALDNAVSKQSAALKGIRSPVAGDADLLIADNIEAANALYKSLVYFAGARCAAVILGASAPIVLTSRSDSDNTKLNSIALAAAVNDSNNR